MSQVHAFQAAQEPQIDYVELDRIIDEEFDNTKENLIMILQSIQKLYNYLPGPALEYVSEKMGIPLSEIYGVGTFYKTFSLKPRGRNIISVCLGTACHVRGSSDVSEHIQEVLDIGEGDTTQDGRFTFEAVRCVGCCSHGPVIKINDDIYSGISPEKVRDILDQYD